MLTIHRDSRLIEGRAAPYGVVAHSRMRLPQRYLPGSFTWDERPWLLINHDHSLQVGRVVALHDLDDGLWATFQVRNGPAGDRALELAAATHTGLSLGVEDVESRIAADGVLEWTSARIIEISLTANPVFA